MMGPLSVPDPSELEDIVELLKDVSISPPVNDDWTVEAGRKKVDGTVVVESPELKTEGTKLREKVKLPAEVKILSQKEVTVTEIFPDIFVDKHNRNRKALTKDDIVGHGEVDFWNMIPENIQKIIIEDRRETAKRQIDLEAQEAVTVGGENSRKAKMRARLQKKLLAKGTELEECGKPGCRVAHVKKSQ